MRVGQVSENRLISLQSHILQMSFLVSFTHQQGIHNPEPNYEPSWATSSPWSSTRFYSIFMSNNMLLQSCIIGRVLKLTKSTWFWNQNKEVYFALRIKTSNDRQKKCIQLAKNCKSKQAAGTIQFPLPFYTFLQHRCFSGTSKATGNTLRIRLGL